MDGTAEDLLRSGAKAPGAEAGVSTQACSFKKPGGLGMGIEVPIGIPVCEHGMESQDYLPDPGAERKPGFDPCKLCRSSWKKDRCV